MRTYTAHLAETIESALTDKQRIQFQAYLCARAQDGDTMTGVGWADAVAWGADRLSESDARDLITKAIRKGALGAGVPVNGLTGASAIAKGARVTLDADGTLSTAGADEAGIGVAEHAAAEESALAVKPWNSSGTFQCIASGAITAGDTVGAAADGKVVTDGPVVIGVALGDAVDGALFEVSPQVGSATVDADAVAEAIGDMNATQAADSQAVIFPSRDPATVYPEGFMTQDSTGIYRGDGATAGGILQASPSFNVAATETFSRSGAAIDFITGDVFADGVKHTRTVRYPRWNREPALGVIAPPLGTKSLVGVTSTGKWLATDTTSPNTANLYVSANEGASWTTLVWGTSIGATVKSVLAIPGPTKEILIAFTQEGGTQMRVSLDDAVTWTAPLLTASYWASITGDFSSGIVVERTPGRALGDCYLLAFPYGSRVSYNAGDPNDGPIRGFRSTKTLSEIEASPGTLSWQLLWKFNIPAFYGSNPTGLGRITTNQIVTGAVVESSGSNTVTVNGAFGGVNTTYKPYVEILTGTGAGQVRRITNATADQLTVSANWTVNPAAGDTLRVVELEADTNGIHVHCACYVPTLSDASTDALFLGVGDNGGNCILKIAGISALTAVDPSTVAAGQPLNWDATSMVKTGVQPTSMYHNGTHLVCAATDVGLGCTYKILDVSPYTKTPTTWQWHFTTYTGGPDFAYTYDAVRHHARGIDLVGTAPTDSAHISGLFVGDASVLDGLVRLRRYTPGSISFAMIAGNYSRHRNHICVIPDEIVSRTGVYLGDAATELLSNTDFASITSNRPTGYIINALGTCVTSVANTETPVFGGGNYWQLAKSSSSDTPEMYCTVDGIVAGDSYEFQVAYRGTHSPYYATARMAWYTAPSTARGTNDSPSGQSLLGDGWQVMSVLAAAPASADRVLCMVRIGAGATGNIQIARPSLIKRTIHGPIGGRAADSLEYTIPASAYRLNLNTKLEFYLRPFHYSPTARTATEDIVSVESHDGYRFLLQYVDDGAGAQGFQFKTFDPAGTDIATTPLGMIMYSLFDTFCIRVKHENGALGCEIITPSESLKASQAWRRPWWPKQIEYGVNQWSAGSRFTGYYTPAVVTQR